jgi:hypothetical protein
MPRDRKKGKQEARQARNKATSRRQQARGRGKRQRGKRQGNTVPLLRLQNSGVRHEEIQEIWASCVCAVLLSTPVL